MNGGQIFTVIIFVAIITLLIAVVLLPSTSSPHKKIMDSFKWLNDLGADKPSVNLSESLRFHPMAQTLCACVACSQQIGVQAITCPHCGTPNDWMHPLLQAVLNGTDKPEPASRAYNFQCKGATINGWCNYRPIGAWATITALVLLVLFFSLSNIWITILLGFGIGGVLTFYKKSETFKADLSAGTWVCSNQYFWAPVRTFFVAKSKQATL
jgi:hypothetical protein